MHANGPAHANTPRTNTTISALRQRLSERLPDYMVPAHIVALEEFPLTSSGKLDRKALPEPVLTATPFEAPQTPTEEIIAGIYAQVLGVERVGVDDSFFDLGGDSLSAMRAVAAINTALDAQLAVRTMFYAPSARSLGQQLGRHDHAVEVVPSRSSRRVRAFPCAVFTTASASVGRIGRLAPTWIAQSSASIKSRRTTMLSLHRFAPWPIAMQTASKLFIPQALQHSRLVLRWRRSPRAGR